MAFASLPEPVLAAQESTHATILAGIGGAGVVTVASILSLAAHLEGKNVKTFDMTGLAQKNGAVVSHVQIAPSSERIHSTCIDQGDASLLIACDLVASCAPHVLALLDRDSSVAIVNDRVLPTGDFQQDGDADFNAKRFLDALAARINSDRMDVFDAAACSEEIGAEEKTNLLMLGYASQKGALPVSPSSIVKAIELGGSAAADNKFVFNYGRLTAHRLAQISEAPLLASGAEDCADADQALDREIDRLAHFLTQYQDDRYSRQYRAFVMDVRRHEAKAVPGSTGFSHAVARGLFKLMAYKDEYEVARLFTNGDFRKELEAQFEGRYRLHFHLAPPTMAPKGAKTNPAKVEFGPWMFHVLRLLSALKGLRGTPLDIFGHTEERRIERRLIVDYMTTIKDVAGRLSPDQIEVAIAIANIPQKIRGYGHVKQGHLDIARREEQELLAKFARAPTRDAAPRRRSEKVADTRVLEQDLSANLGMAVVIDHQGHDGGRLTISYKTLEQLDELCQLLAGGR
ncbi:MAG TPA: 2-oxoacid:acceptor oxidoreductase family protein [Parvularculaceae bacterium]|nr:2-oxoacid:acceptor oxidoreductase family protein [Parvularculaceae bacterium]